MFATKCKEIKNDGKDSEKDKHTWLYRLHVERVTGNIVIEHNITQPGNL